MCSIRDRILQGFKPIEHGLPADFLLTKLTEMKGCGCKELLDLLDSLRDPDDDVISSSDSKAVGIGLDSCVIPLKHRGMFLVQTTDFFYPLIDDPYLMGRITCANVLSDLYAMGVIDCDNMLMLLGVCTELNITERSIVVSNFMKGFKDTATEAGTAVRGGQTVRSPWLLLGGVASSVCSNAEMAQINGAHPGNVLVLTKPLGTQLAVNSFEWLKRDRRDKLDKTTLNEEEIITAYQQAIEQMCRLNRNAARLLHELHSLASTDVTGFGILGHADNLAKNQLAQVRFRIDTLPVIQHMDQLARDLGNGFNLFTGTSAETSGGLLVVLKDGIVANEFIRRLNEEDHTSAWIVGKVEDGERGAFIDPDQKIIPVKSHLDKDSV